MKTRITKIQQAILLVWAVLSTGCASVSDKPIPSAYNTPQNITKPVRINHAAQDLVDESSTGIWKINRITDSQCKLAVSGNVQLFWESRMAMGDPIARLALASLEPPGGVIDILFGGASINQ